MKILFTPKQIKNLKLLILENENIRNVTGIEWGLELNSELDQFTIRGEDKHE